MKKKVQWKNEKTNKKITAKENAIREWYPNDDEGEGVGERKSIE